MQDATSLLLFDLPAIIAALEFALQPPGDVVHGIAKRRPLARPEGPAAQSTVISGRTARRTLVVRVTVSLTFDNLGEVATAVPGSTFPLGRHYGHGGAAGAPARVARRRRCSGRRSSPRAAR